VDVAANGDLLVGVVGLPPQPYGAAADMTPRTRRFKHLTPMTRR
jgi:hypothetical protein